MSLFARLFSSCWLGHAAEPVMVFNGTQMRRECRRCQADMGPWISGQMFPVLPLQPLKAVVGTAKDRDLAGVVTLAKWSKR